MNDQLDEAPLQSSVIWPVFGDLMACLFGLFVLFFVWAIAFQVDLTEHLKRERASRTAETSRLRALESALAGPRAAGRITLTDGRIGIRGSVLFELNSAELQPEGQQLIADLSLPLKAYAEQHDEVIMVSGFTDDLKVQVRAQGFKDNWDLSAQRALTVTRALMAAGLPGSGVFAAGFGEQHPVVPNTSSENRARNRRVEISPIPRNRASLYAP
jgi:flagellar motor protein MotB